MAKLVYFAWVRERVGCAEEEIALPEGVSSVSALIDWLKGRDEGYAHAFAQGHLIRVALDRTHVKHDADPRQAREIAFFPPMTGG